MSFCGLIKRISPKICIPCVRVKINKRSFEPFCVWIVCVVDIVPGCVHVCLCFAVGVGSSGVCMFHVLNCFEL